MYIYMHIYMNIYIFICKYIYMYKCMYISSDEKEQRGTNDSMHEKKKRKKSLKGSPLD